MTDKKLQIINTHGAGVGALKGRCIDGDKDYGVHNLFGDIASGTYNVEEINENKGLNGVVSFDINLSSNDAQGVSSCPASPVLTEFFLPDITEIPGSVMLENAAAQGKIGRIEHGTEVGFYRSGT